MGADVVVFARALTEEDEEGPTWPRFCIATRKVVR